MIGIMATHKNSKRENQQDVLSAMSIKTDEKTYFNIKNSKYCAINCIIGGATCVKQICLLCHVPNSVKH